ncbi:hypothetical protein J6590_051312 [Homalodisca vitripennis]|nr:hypothetical protein J6590_051312 [Homalodisca vitripennis]
MFAEEIHNKLATNDPLHLFDIRDTYKMVECKSHFSIQTKDTQIPRHTRKVTVQKSVIVEVRVKIKSSAPRLTS